MAHTRSNNVLISCRCPMIVFVGSKMGSVLLAESVHKVCACVYV